MKILVLVKQVPDTEAKITLSGGNLNEEGIKWIIAPYDEIALEEAIRIKEKIGDTAITVISVGPERSSASLRTAYAMGADHAILVKHDDYEMLNSFMIAEAIIKAIGDEKYDIILAGRQATDSDNGQVPVILATKLDLAIVSFVNEVTVNEGQAELKCEVEGGEAVYEAQLPVVVTANDRLNEPRYPSLKGIMASKKKPIDTKELKDLGVSLESKIQVDGFESPPERPSGKVIEGESAQEKAASLANALHNEIKVI